jgi:hypothetical protein
MRSLFLKKIKNPLGNPALDFALKYRRRLAAQAPGIFLAFLAARRRGPHSLSLERPNLLAQTRFFFGERTM